MPDSPEHPHLPGFLLKIRFGVFCFFFILPSMFFLMKESAGKSLKVFSADLFNRGVYLAKCPELYGQEES